MLSHVEQLHNNWRWLASSSSPGQHVQLRAVGDANSSPSFSNPPRHQYSYPSARFYIYLFPTEQERGSFRARGGIILPPSPLPPPLRQHALAIELLWRGTFPDGCQLASSSQHEGIQGQTQATLFL
jgi:hypothetical protein